MTISNGDTMSQALVKIHDDQFLLVAPLKVVEYIERQADYLPRVRFSFVPSPRVDSSATMLYLDSRERYLQFDESTSSLTLSFPWEEVPNTTLLRMSFWLLSERMRQERGEYLFHASAVVRDGRMTVLAAPSEGGKTITAIELCRKHGFSLFANDQVALSCSGDRAIAQFGDAVINCRYSSIAQYSFQLATELFGTEATTRPGWDRKRLVDPSALGIAREASRAVPVDTMALVTIDSSCAALFVEEYSSGSPKSAIMPMKIELSSEIAAVIRGGTFTTFRPDSTLSDLFVPTLDSPDLVSRRVALLNTLFSSARIVGLRGTLGHVCEYLGRR